MDTPWREADISWHLTFPRAAQKRRNMIRKKLTLLVATALALGGVVATTPPAQAATNQFRGMNWAVLGDNFTKGPLVISGLSQTDSNATVRAKANALYDDMAAIGVNTVRLPINTHTVGTTWWNNYRGRHRRRDRPRVQGDPRVLGGRRRVRRQDHEPRRVEHDVV